MRFKLAILPLALFTGSFEAAIAQAKAPASPDPATVRRLQAEVAQNEAKGDYKSAALELRILANLYRNDPATRSTIYLQLAQVSTQLHDDAKAAEYRALAQGLPANSYATPAPAPAPQPVAAPISTADIFAAPPTSPPAAAPATAPKASGTDRFSKFLAQAQQIVAQAQQATKQKAGNTPQPNQPLPPQPGAFPAAPDAAIGAAPLPPPPTDNAAAAGVVIGYDANNQPIFAPAPPAQTGGQTPPPTQYPAPPPQ